MQWKALPGFRDFYPDALALRNHIFATWRDVARRYAFEEYDGPPLEPLELYTKKSGDEIVRQLYRFRDRGDREVALRPEMTPTLARMVGMRAQALKKPIRWFSMPQLFRYERHQRGRLREHFQLNMDIIGESSPLADAEIIAAAIDIVRSLGFGPGAVRARVSDRQLLKTLLISRGVTQRQLPAAYAAMDKLEREPHAVIRERLKKAKVRKEVIDGIFEIAALNTVDSALNQLRGVREHGEEGVRLLRLSEALDWMGLSEFVTLDFGIVRGLAYYTSTVFEVFDASGDLRAICGGGRYDNLLEELAGVSLPCVGFGMGDVVLAELLRDRKPFARAPNAIDAFFLAVGVPDEKVMLRLAHEMRDRGLSIEYGLHFYSLRKQFELAASRGARWAVIIGPAEREREAVLVKEMRTGREEPIPMHRLEEYLKANHH